MPVAVTASLASTLIQPCYFVLANIIINLCGSTMGGSFKYPFESRVHKQSVYTVSTAVIAPVSSLRMIAIVAFKKCSRQDVTMLPKLVSNSLA